jgi:iron complex outermembrane recepter protein
VSYQASKRTVFVFCVLEIAGIITRSALAQQSDHPPASSSDSAQLSEIVVTAEKRESTVQNTPISLTAVSEADIQSRGASDLASLLTTVPGVSIRTSGPGLTEFEMRGMSSTGGNSATVGFYYDDTLLTATANANEGKVVISPALYDVSRIEVLRGPQGTLYGSGSMGGTIKIVPNAPNLNAFDASAEAVMGGTDGGGFNHAENAMINLPFGGGVAALRIVGSYEDDSGWVSRIVTQPGTFPLPTDNGAVRGNVLAAPVAEDYKGANETERTTVRISALVKPTDGLSITPAFFYQKLTAGGLPYIDSDPGTDAHYQPFDVAERVYDLFKLSSLKLVYRTEAFEIDSDTAYWNRYQTVPQDASESWQTGLGLPSFSPTDGGVGAGVSEEYNYSHQTTEELRVSSVGDSSFKWLGGYFYQDFMSALDIFYPVQGDALGSTNLFTEWNPLKLQQQSIFGEVTYNVTPALAATAGLRRYYYSTTTVSSQTGALVGGSSFSSTGERDQGVTPKVSLSYTFSPDLMVYATGAKGFRPGGGTGPIITSGPDSCEKNLQSEYGTTSFIPGPDSFQSDHVWSYELGEKWLGADNRVSVNAAIYFEAWTGVQQTNNLTECGEIYTANAGNAHVYGSELEVRAVIVPELVVSLNTGYTHAALVSADLLHSSFNPGTPLQDDPKWTGSASLAYRHPLNDQFALTARIDTNYVGSHTDVSYLVNTLPSYQLTNIRAGLEAKQWSAVLFVNNVANKRALLSDINIDAINLADYNRVTINQPLTAGIDLNYRFGL